MSRRRRLLKRLGWLCVLLAAVPLLAYLAFALAVAWIPYPRATEKLPAASTIIEDRNGIELAAFAAADGQWRLPLTQEQVSPYLLQAIVAAEDSRFFQHHGVDWKSVAGATWQDLIHLRVVRGASTISMQVQHLRRPQPRGLVNKALQTVRAEQLERRESKNQILLEYVNRAPFGGNLVGAGAASWRYFGRPCRELSLGQATLLAGLPQSPNRLRPDRFPQRAAARRRHVLDRMLACGMISRKEHDEAASEPITALWLALPQGRDSSAGGLPALVRLSHEQNGRFRCTIDGSVQRLAYAAGRERLDLLRNSGVHAAAIVVLDTPTAEPRAAVSFNDDGSMIDLTRRPRSTGSTLKPFIYATAFDAGICAPGTLVSDTPASWSGYQPDDFDREFRGPLTAAEALAQSRNIPAMLVLSKVGVEPAIGLMDAAGLHCLVRDPARYGLTLAIGGAEATPIEIAQAYAALGRGGIAIPVHLTSNVATEPALPPRFIRPAACWQVLGALSETERTMAVCPEACGSHVAWKTGTSSGRRDAWCAAVTRRYTVVVWLGNSLGESSGSLVGQDAAAPLALGLIAALDSRGEPWPVVPEEPILVACRTAAQDGELILRSPAPGQQFVLQSDLPADRQRIRLEAARRGAASSQVGMLWWFVDGQLVGTTTELRLWWDPTPGPHEVRVTDSRLRSAVAKITVHSGNVR
jgi:penicillin-binding protein 1C